MTGDLTPTERSVLAMLVAVANAGLPAPSNDVIASRIGAQSISTSSGVISQLERKGLISVQRFNQARVVTIIASGLSTKAPVGAKPHWRARVGPANPRPARKRPERDHVIPPSEPDFPLVRVDRDPCFLCGTRGDLGCAHRATVKPAPSLSTCACPTCARLRAPFPADGELLAAFRGPPAVPATDGPSSRPVENRPCLA